MPIHWPNGAANLNARGAETAKALNAHRLDGSLSSRFDDVGSDPSLYELLDRDALGRAPATALQHRSQCSNPLRPSALPAPDDGLHRCHV